MHAGQRSNETDGLETIRVRAGNEACLQAFNELCGVSNEGAAVWLNRQDTSFPCLFLLLEAVQERNMMPQLNARHRAAADIVRACKAGEEKSPYLYEKSDENASVLRWMLESSRDEYALGDAFLKVMDIVAAVLIITYEDKEALPIVERMIFERKKRGLCYHDLVWAFFRMEDFCVMLMMAQHLQSGDNDEVNFARSLLNLGEGDAGEQYEEYIQWLRENEPFLFFTYEGQQYASEPMIVDVDYDRKYMHKTSRIYGYDPLEPEDEEEEACLSAFRALDPRDRELLSGHSHKVFGQNREAWEAWMRETPQRQLAGLGEEGEGLV